MMVKTIVNNVTVWWKKPPNSHSSCTQGQQYRGVCEVLGQRYLNICLMCSMHILNLSLYIVQIKYIFNKKE